MRLTDQEAEQFFDLMWSLQNFVNLELEINPDIKTSMIKYNLLVIKSITD